MTNYQPGTITKNTGYLAVSYVLQKILAFVYFIILARFITTDSLGKYVFAFSFATIYSIIIDLGLSPVLTREIAKTKEKAEIYLSSVIVFKLIMAAIAYLAIIISINLLGYPAITKTLVYLTGLIMVLDSFSLSFYAALRGIQNLRFEAMGAIYYQSIVIILGTLALILKLSLPILILVYVLASLFNFFYSFRQVKQNIGIKFKLIFDKKILKFLFIIAVPFALAGVFNRVFSYIDTILLSKLAGDVAVGIYSIAYKLTYALQFVPAALGAALFPAMSNFYLNSPENLKKSFEKSFFYLSLIALPVIFGVIALAPEIITTLYGTRYLNSILPLQILIMAIIFIFLNYPIGALLNSCDRQKINTANVGIAMVINIALNLILIPKLSYTGAAIAGLLGQASLFALGFYQANKIIKINHKFLAKKISLILLSSFLMFFFVIMFRKHNWIIVGGFSAILYLGLIMLFEVLKLEEVKELANSVIRKKE